MRLPMKCTLAFIGFVWVIAHVANAPVPFVLEQALVLVGASDLAVVPHWQAAPLKEIAVSDAAGAAVRSHQTR